MRGPRDVQTDSVDALSYVTHRWLMNRAGESPVRDALIVNGNRHVAGHKSSKPIPYDTTEV